MQNKIEKKKILWEVGEAGSGLHFIKMRVECIKKTAAQNRVHALQRIQQMEVLHRGGKQEKGEKTK